jgi:hypothetical protein
MGNMDAELGRKYRFTSTNQPKNNGRKPSMIKKFIKANNLGIQDVIAIFKNITTVYSFEQVKRMVQDGKDLQGKPLTALVWGFCIAWIADAKRGFSSGGFLSQMMDRAFGPVKNQIEMSGGLDPVQDMTPAERSAYLAELIRRKGERENKEKDS